MTALDTDGRNARFQRTHKLILNTTRELMRGGDFRPSIAAVSRASGCSNRSVFQHFHDVEALHREALLDAETGLVIVSRIYGPDAEDTAKRILEAVVFGRTLPLPETPSIAAE